MSSESPLSSDLLDLKLLPAWVKETDSKSYDHYTGDEGAPREGRRGGDRRDGGRKDGRGRGPNRGKRPGGPSRPDGSSRPGDRRPSRPDGAGRDHRQDKRPGRDSGKFGKTRPGGSRHEGRAPRRETPPPAPLNVEVRFLPRSPVLESVVTQIKSAMVAYSLFHLARLFLEKPERYEVRVKAKPETPLFQLGEEGALGSNKEFLDRDSFRLAQNDFYKVEVTQGEPIKGNFTSIARDRLSGTLLGPTNYHSYQPRLRTLYEQRFSRRMSFSDYQRQIEIVSDPAMVERWKEEAQKITTYSTLREETPVNFTSPAEVERHFRATYLPELIQNVNEATIGGVPSRRLPDRPLHRAIEDAWAHEFRSPSNMMQELAGQFREAGLNIFRHRRGMLFVSPIRVRPLVYDQAAVSPTVNAILELLKATPRTGRKELADKLIGESEDAESRKLALASDLHWLVREGHVIEFNDGSLDLPREKVKNVEAAVSAAEEKPAASEKSDDSPQAEVGAIDVPSPDGSGVTGPNRPSSIAGETANGSGEPPVTEENKPTSAPSSSETEIGGG